MADNIEEPKEVLAAEDIAAPAGPDEHNTEAVKVRTPMTGIVRFSRKSKIAGLFIILFISGVFAYSFGAFGPSKPKVQATPPPAAAIPKQEAQGTPQDTTIDDLTKNAPKGIAIPQKGLPPMPDGTAPAQDTGKPPTQDNGTNDALGAALNNASSTADKPNANGAVANAPPGGDLPQQGQGFDTSGPGVPKSDAPGGPSTNNNSGAGVPNPGAVNPSQPSFEQQQKQQAEQTAIQTRMADQIQAKKASFYIGSDNKGMQAGDQPAQVAQANTPGNPPGNGAGDAANPGGPTTNGYGGTVGGNSGGGQSGSGDDSSKIRFANGQGERPAYSTNQEMPAVGKYELWAGSTIAGQLDTGINTDLPGPVVAHVQHDIYDSKTGQTLLIPKGTRIIGRYNSTITNGQTRVQVLWDRMIWPDGRFIALDGQIGTEPEGQSGLFADVQDHKGRIIGAALFTAVLSSGAQMLANKGGGGGVESTSTTGNGQIISQTVGGSLAQTGQEYINRRSNIPDELTVPKGKQFDVLLDRTIVLQPWKFQS